MDAVKDDIRDQYETAKEISDAISTPSGFGADIDEDELGTNTKIISAQPVMNGC